MAGESIFIGYRRDDTADVAGRIYDALALRFGRHRLFKDVDSLTPGTDFGQHIRSLLPNCRVALILIGPNWIDAHDQTGRRRLDDPNDWVRIEIETALATPGLAIVPVLVNGARMPDADQLPEGLQPLARRHAANIRRDPDFQSDVSKLAEAIGGSVRSGMVNLGTIRAKAGIGTNWRTPVGLFLVAAMSAAAVVALLVWSPWGRVPDVAERQSTNGIEDVRSVPASDGGSPAVSSAARTEGEFDDCSGAGWCPTMVVVPGGRYLMGAPAGQHASESERPQHEVTIRRFAVGKFEITFDQWEACASRGGCTSNRAPDDASFGRGARPVINVSWRDAQEYVRWLSYQTNQSYRLLTESEWEYAARAGTTTAYFTGSSIRDDQARFSARSTSPAGSFPPNRFGLYDMTGNVWEWVEDCFPGGQGVNYAVAPTNGSAVTSGMCGARWLRGGAWDSDDNFLTSSFRQLDFAETTSPSFGFRVARSLPAE
jgi:formylglycine-generating enzyme required for sulfatase activity